MVRLVHVVLAVILVPVVTSVGIDAPLGPGDPGLVVVVGEPPQPLQFTLPALSPYKFQYEVPRLTLWDSGSMDNVVPPDTVFVAPTVAADVDGDGDVDLGDFALFGQCFGGSNTPPAPGCPVDADIDDDGDVDLADFALFGQQFTGAGARATVSITVFVEGLTASTALADTTITLLTDPDEDMTFTVEATQAVTVLEIGISPTNGVLGTAINITISPALAPFEFSPNTSATWSGTYSPEDTPTTDPFAIAYDEKSVHEAGPASAVLILGEGENVAGDVGQPSLGGVLDGLLILQFAGFSASRAVSFTVDPSYTFVRGGAGGAPVSANAIPILDPNSPTWGDYITLESARAEQALLVILAEKNAITSVLRPTALAVELISEDAAGTEIDRASLTTFLEMERGDDFGVDRLVYYSDWQRPIVFVGVPVDDQQHPTLHVLEVDPNGKVFAIFGEP